MSDCEHESFRGDFKIARLSHEKDSPIDGYSADITIKCTQCGLPFRFKGVPLGVSQTGPTVSIDGTELRCPIEPSDGSLIGTTASYAMPDPKGEVH